MIYLLLQIIFLIPSLSFKNSINFIYMGLLLNLKLQESKIFYHLLLASILGIILDILTQSIGCCLSAATIYVYLRYVIAKQLIPISHLNLGVKITYKSGILLYFSINILPILFHNMAYYFIENIVSLSLSQIQIVLCKSIYSTIYFILSMKVLSFCKILFSKLNTESI